MCGRFALNRPPKALAEQFNLDGDPNLFARYNIAPTQDVASVRVLPERGSRALVFMKWGLVPHWSKDPSIGARLINARSETAAEKPAFRSAMKYRRCLIPADGFYEWKKTGGSKQPFFIRLKEDRPLAFAGLWELWESPERSLESCTILTTVANEMMTPLHDRMPVILDPADYDLWLDTEMRDSARLAPMLVPYPSGKMMSYPVSPLVNNARFDDPRCMAKIEMEG